MGLIRLTVLVAFLVCTVPAPASAQTEKKPPDKFFWLTYAPRFRTIEFWGGMTVPLSHRSITELWLRGPGAGMNLMVLATNNYVVGIGGEISLLSFRKGVFAAKFPGVPPQFKDMALVHLTLGMRYYTRPSVRMSPYVGMDIGFARLTGAEYKRIVDGVRQTYYDVPGIARLTFGASAGLDYYIFRRMALQGELRGVYMHNDPNAGFFLSLRMGVKVAL